MGGVDNPAELLNGTGTEEAACSTTAERVDLTCLFFKATYVLDKPDALEIVGPVVSCSSNKS